MTTVRDEVRALCVDAYRAGAQDASSLNATLHDWNARVDAITNLVLEVKELEWEECRGATKPRWQAQAFMGQYYEIQYEEEYAAPYYADTIDDEFPTLEDAKAACQADFAKRIQSALTAKPAPATERKWPSFPLGCESAMEEDLKAANPAPAVSDEMVETHPRYQSLFREFAERGRHNEALIEAIRNASQAEEVCKLLAGIRSTWAGRDPASCVVIAKAEEKLAAQAALINGNPALSQAPTEADIRADERERLAKFALSDASNLCAERYLPDERAKALRYLADWLRSQGEG